MSGGNDEHRFECRLVWTGATKGPTADYDTYSREYRVDFEGKPSLRGTAAPHRGDPAPTTGSVCRTLSGCHCLSYPLEARAGIPVVGYEDEVFGRTERVDGVVKFTEVVLTPKVSIAPGSDADKARALHERAHAICFIANSVNFPVRVSATVAAAAPV
jgi:organic hydroperoxide reductase OsmC/OhrA